MCGRFTLFSSAEAIAQIFEVDVPADIIPSYNIAPSQTVNAVPTMTYLLMPQMTKLFSGWLYPSLDIASPITDNPAKTLESSELLQPSSELNSAEYDLELVVIPNPENSTTDN